MKEGLVSQLEELHFTASEAKVYAALAELGQSPAGAIIKNTGLHRSVVYESFDKLITRKLVIQVTKNKKAYFQLADPHRLVQTAQHQLDLVEKIVPQLQALSLAKNPEITVYEGLASYRQFWLDSVKNLPVGTTDYVAGSITKQWQTYMGPSLKDYLRLHLRRRIKWQMIVFDLDEVEQGLLKKYPKLHDYRYIPRAGKTIGNFNVWGGDTLILHSTMEPMIIEIKNTALVQVFENIFDILWAQGKKI